MNSCSNTNKCMKTYVNKNEVLSGEKMKVYVLARNVDGKEDYLTDDYGFTDNIECAVKAKNAITAMILQWEFEEEVTRRINIKNLYYKSNLYPREYEC